MSWLFVSNGKSGKREVAVSLLIFWAFISAYLWFWLPKEDVTFYRELYGMITTSVFLFAGGAFGFDAYLKNRDVAPAARMPANFGKGKQREID